MKSIVYSYNELNDLIKVIKKYGENEAVCSRIIELSNLVNQSKNRISVISNKLRPVKKYNLIPYRYKRGYKRTSEHDILEIVRLRRMGYTNRFIGEKFGKTEKFVRIICKANM